jgi:hypothetical protein
LICDTEMYIGVGHNMLKFDLAVLRIDEYDDASGELYAQIGNDEFGAVIEEDRDAFAWLYALCHERVSELCDIARELCVRDGLILKKDGRALRVVLCVLR